MAKLCRIARAYQGGIRLSSVRRKFRTWRPRLLPTGLVPAQFPDIRRLDIVANEQDADRPSRGVSVMLGEMCIAKQLTRPAWPLRKCHLHGPAVEDGGDGADMEPSLQGKVEL